MIIGNVVHIYNKAFMNPEKERCNQFCSPKIHFITMPLLIVRMNQLTAMIQLDIGVQIFTMEKDIIKMNMQIIGENTSAMMVRMSGRKNSVGILFIVIN